MSFTISELAKKHGVKPGTMRERLRRGWSHKELLQNFRIPAEDLQKLRARFADEAAERQRSAEVASLQYTHEAPEARPQPQDPEEAHVNNLASKLMSPGALAPELTLTLEFVRIELIPGFTYEKWERRFEKDWASKKWKVAFFDLPQDQQELAERLFPDDVSLWRRARELADRLVSEELNNEAEIEALKASL
jgi:hypothetical protein